MLGSNTLWFLLLVDLTDGRFNFGVFLEDIARSDLLRPLLSVIVCSCSLLRPVFIFVNAVIFYSCLKILKIKIKGGFSERLSNQ